jgi:glycosyltransferase involved in cell wall biosynthesis
MPRIRERASDWSRQAKLKPLVRDERERAARRASGLPVIAPEPLDLFDDAAVARAAGLPLDAVLWRPVSANEVTDRWSAARFLIDLWRKRPGIREQFPSGLGAGGDGAFARWLEHQGGAAELDLQAPAVQHLLDALQAKLSARGRQMFLANKVLSAVLPQGLTPAGMRGLFRWFMHCHRSGIGLRREEIWWLFLEAQTQPERELVLAHHFSPAWQQAHPDGVTVFGRDAFSAWFAEAYGAAGDWLDPIRWPVELPPAQQIRIAYGARQTWQSAHPEALADPSSARALLAWLSSPSAGFAEPVRQWCANLDHASVAAELARPGVNVLGHFCYPSGLRVSVESMVEAMGLAGVSTSLRDVWTDLNRDDPHHVEFRGPECHDFTIIHAQPEPFFDDAYERAGVAERAPRSYRIAYWYWEFDSIPDSWVAQAGKVDEVWAATEFVARGLRARLAIPVRTLFPGVRLAPYERRSKAYFGLKESPFTFLFTFHLMSVMERKNPLGLIRAFKQAFGAQDDACLVLKTSFGERYPEQLQELRDAATGANITVINQIYSPDEVLSLMDACDAYVSLHRSEGLGLTMAEAMLMGKPVIATHFSGNVDFMDETNSLPVAYEVVKLGRPIPPYSADMEWAAPSVEHAARQMRRLYDDQAFARELGARAKASAEANLSLEAAGRRIAARLDEIRALRRAAAPAP